MLSLEHLIKGKVHEKVYNVVWGDAVKRKLDKKGKLTAVGNTVNAKTASWKNTIGDAELVTVWKASDFNPALLKKGYFNV